MSSPCHDLVRSQLTTWGGLNEPAAFLLQDTATLLDKTFGSEVKPVRTHHFTGRTFPHLGLEVEYKLVRYRITTGWAGDTVCVGYRGPSGPARESTNPAGLIAFMQAHVGIQGAACCSWEFVADDNGMGFDLFG